MTPATLTQAECGGMVVVHETGHRSCTRQGACVGTDTGHRIVARCDGCEACRAEARFIDLSADTPVAVAGAVASC